MLALILFLFYSLPCSPSFSFYKSFFSFYTLMEVKVSSDATDVDFHPDPTLNLFSTSLLSGKVQLFNYDDLQQHQGLEETDDSPSSSRVKRIQSIRPTKKSIRSVSFNRNGDSIWSASKDGNLYRIDSTTYQIVDSTLR